MVAVAVLLLVGAAYWLVITKAASAPVRLRPPLAAPRLFLVETWRSPEAVVPERPGRSLPEPTPARPRAEPPRVEPGREGPASPPRAPEFRAPPLKLELPDGWLTPDAVAPEPRWLFNAERQAALSAARQRQTQVPGDPDALGTYDTWTNGAGDFRVRTSHGCFALRSDQGSSDGFAQRWWRVACDR